MTDDTQKIRIDLQEELTQDIPEIRNEFLKRFKQDIEEFIEYLITAYLSWQKIESMIKDDKKMAYIGALAFTALNLHIVSFKLFLSGYPVAAGNLQRQVIETLALLILCSEKSLDFLNRYITGKYSPNKAIKDLKKQQKKLAINENAVMALEKGHNFYHKYSHPSPMTIAEQIRFSDQALILGAAFDIVKIEEYSKEVNGKVGLARVIGNVIEGVTGKIANW